MLDLFNEIYDMMLEFVWPLYVSDENKQARTSNHYKLMT